MLVNYSDFAACQVENSLANVINLFRSSVLETSSNFLTVMLAVWLKVLGVTNGSEINMRLV